jgi:hypothetical protein
MSVHDGYWADELTNFEMSQTDAKLFGIDLAVSIGQGNRRSRKANASERYRQKG